ncbi:hypothetical protein TNCV_556861 [Trichonephila clavipes]|uniref:Uncharacterized protein n=1 Tax=Trichonephila clavipes TaxID=2585209 RepID=A0A8X6RKT4_TRICX|nr:hypothetical protein TNCV_556861 [Trichonephila clavipes]
MTSTELVPRLHTTALHQMKNINPQHRSNVYQSLHWDSSMFYKQSHLLQKANTLAHRSLKQTSNESIQVPAFDQDDEVHLWLNGYVNKQNCRNWSEANPQVYVETPLHPEKLTVWCALWAGGILLQKRCRPQRYSEW